MGDARVGWPQVWITLQTINPSNIDIGSLGNVTMDAYVEGHYVLTATAQVGRVRAVTLLPRQPGGACAAQHTAVLG